MTEPSDKIQIKLGDVMKCEVNGGSWYAPIIATGHVIVLGPPCPPPGRVVLADAPIPKIPGGMQ